MSRRILPAILLGASLLAAGCKSAQPPAYKGEGHLLAEGPAREVTTAPGGGAVAWLADPVPAREKGVRAAEDVLIGTVKMVGSTGGAPVTLGAGAANLPGSFFFSPNGKHLGGITGWDFAKQQGTLVLADVATGQTKKLADEVSYFAFDRDSKQVGWVAGRNLYVAPIGGEAKMVADDISTFDFAPGGKAVLARARSIGGGDLLLIDLANTEKPKSLGEKVADYTFSPDGKRIAFTARDDEGRTNLFLATMDGQSRKVGAGVPLFRFSPDGAHLAFLGDVSPKKQFGDLYLLRDGAPEAAKIGEKVTDFQFSPTSKRIAWQNKYDPQARGGTLTWTEIDDKLAAQTVAKDVPSFIWSHDGNDLAYVERILDPNFSLDLFLARLGKGEPVKVGRGVFGYSFDAKDDRLLFRTECTRNARSCELHAVKVATPDQPATKLASGIFTYELDPTDASLLMITYARTDADALDLAAVPADGSASPRTLDRMVVPGTRFLGGDQDRIAYAVIDQKRLGVYVAEAPDFSKPADATAKQQ